VGALPEHRVQNPCQDGHNNFISNAFEELRGIVTKHTTSYEAVMLPTARGSREVTLSCDKEAPSDVTVHYVQEGAKCGKKRHKQHLEGTVTITNCDDSHDWETGGSDVRCITTAMCSNKRLARPPADHFKRLLEEACPNHA
jgi:hypothetical protein